MTALMYKIANEPHTPIAAIRPDLPQTIDKVINRALAKRPEERFQSGAEMAAALRACGVADVR